MNNLTNYKETLQEHNVKLQQAIDKAEALPNAGGGSAVVTGEITVSGSLVIPEIIGKENVLLSFMDNATLDSIGGSQGVAYVWSVFIANDSVLYCIQYNETNLSAYNDNLLIYDKATGAINFNQPYNELFYPGKYRYVAW